MKEHRYKLEKYKGKRTRYFCPSCRERYAFARYKDTVTDEYLNDSVGKCNREQRCGYHYTPKEYFRDNKEVSQSEAKPLLLKTTKPYVPKPVSYISKVVFEESLSNKEPNIFIQMLEKVFGYEKAKQLVQQYHIGTSDRWPGATTFWQVDTKERIRTGKIMLFDVATFKRVKKPYSHINWVHSLLYPDNYELRQCLFGEDQLKEYPKKMVAIVESEKTAVFAAGFEPDYLWLATGGLGNLSPERCRALKGRQVVLFPDLGCYHKWVEKAEVITSIADVRVTDLLERNATEEQREQGFDIADYLLGKAQWINKETAMPIQLSSKDFVATPVQTNLGEEFKKAILLFAKTRDGGMYDLLFDADGDFLNTSESELAQKINSFFDKKFIVGAIDNAPCFINSVS